MTVLKIGDTQFIVSEGAHAIISGSQGRQEALDRLMADTRASGGQVYQIEPSTHRLTAASEMNHLAMIAKERRELLAAGPADLSPVLVIVDHVRHLSEKDTRTLNSLARQGRRLNITLLVTDSVESLPEELVELVPNQIDLT